MTRVDKLSKLVAVFDQLQEMLLRIDDPVAVRLAENWTSQRDRYVNPEGAPRSTFASGMEQGIRETPMLLRGMAPGTRELAARALADAISAHYPELMLKDAARL